MDNSSNNSIISSNKLIYLDSTNHHNPNSKCSNNSKGCSSNSNNSIIFKIISLNNKGSNINLKCLTTQVYSSRKSMLTTKRRETARRKTKMELENYHVKKFIRCPRTYF